MKNIFLLVAFLASQTLFPQVSDSLKVVKKDSVSKSKDKSFFERLKIGQSMETIDERGEPAQIVLTFPEEGADSYLINLGVAYELNSKQKLKSKIKAEFHKNTLAEKEQDNVEVGYQGTWKFRQIKNTSLFLIFDPKYVYDGVDLNNAVASNILFTWARKNSRLNFNRNNFRQGRKGKDGKAKDIITFNPSIFIGTQIQENFKSESEDLEGFIVRPLASGSFYFTFLRKEEKFIKYSILYTGRKDVVNNTNIDEGYSKLFKTGLEVFIPNKAIEISLGLSYNNGSDPIKGLADQEYWLLSFNMHI